MVVADTTKPVVRVRFSPSPTGNPHVGMIRTALFNWAFARHHQGTFVFRIEDTDASRDSEESYEQLLDSMRWLGLTWDEGPEIGGPHAPYRQSQRRDIYGDVAQRLLAAGHVYECFCTPEELEADRESARSQNRAPGYSRTCRHLNSEQITAHREAGRTSVLRFAMPDHEITWDDLVRGPLSFRPEFVPDYVIMRANGDPLYPLVNPLDDALMHITHVLRGEDLLSSTPRQIAMHAALADIGIGSGRTPAFGHLPYVMGEGNRKLSKRDPESSLLMYRETGYLPEGLLNYLALLGWSPGEDREFFSLTEMAEVFDISRVNASPARFDIKKCTAINGDWVRHLSHDELITRLTPFLTAAQLVDEPMTTRQRAVLDQAVPLIAERMDVLSQAVPMLSFLLVDADDIEIDPEQRALLDDAARQVLLVAITALGELDTWQADQIQQVLRQHIVEGMGLKPKHAFTPLRVAITGRKVSPPLFESIEILGRERTLARLRRASTPLA